MSDFEQQLKRRLQALPATGTDHEPDFEALAAFVDNALNPRERQQMLTHLSNCEQCRRLVVETSAAVTQPEPPQSTPVKRWRLKWLIPAMGSAAVAVVALLIIAFPSNNEPENWFASAPAVTFAQDWNAAAQTVYRSSGQAIQIAPLSPRRSVTENLAPTLSWRVSDAQALTDGEIMVIDDNQSLVISWQLNQPVNSAAWPSQADRLQPDRVYAWKVSYWTENGPITSVFTPFRTPSEEHGPAAQEHGLEKQLQQLISSGSYSQALALCLAEAQQQQASACSTVRQQLIERLQLSNQEQMLLGLQQ